MVLMVRVEVLPVPFESYISGETATPKPAISITIAIDGNVYIDTTVVTLDELVESVRSKLMDKPESVLYLVMEDGHSVIDRGPLLTGAWDRLRAVNLEVFLVGSPSEEKLDATP
tara:strand:- start:22 stop:363 length:342 start_codon:yes stop_codon:yes gene_type:complete